MANTGVQNRIQGMKTIWLAIMLVFIAELFAYTWCRVQNVRVGYEIASLTTRYEQQRTIRKNLAIELARLKAPNRIEALARQLGLAPPATRQIVVME
jgi:cell division protein FtsL